MDSFNNKIDCAKDFVGIISEIEDDEELFLMLKKIREGIADADAEVILNLLIHKNMRVREQAKDIILKSMESYSIKDKSRNNRCRIILKKLVRYLKNRDPGVRNLAVEILSAAVDIYLPEIGGLLQQESEDIKIYACQILGNSKEPESIDYIRLALQDTNVNVRNCAILALEYTAVDFDISFLIELLNFEKEPWIRFSVTEVINKKGSKIYLKKLLPLIKTEPDFIRLNILKIYESYCSQEFLVELIRNSVYFKGEMHSYLNKTVISIINSKNIDFSDNKIIIDYLIRTAKTDKNPWNVYQAVKLLSDIKDKDNKELFNLLKKYLNHEHPLVKTAAIEAMVNYTGLDVSLFLDGLFEKKDECKINQDNIFKKV